MNTNNTPPTPPTNASASQPTDQFGITAGFAARVLSAGLGESEATWLTRLANARRPGRKPLIPWLTAPSGNPAYDLDDVNAFIAQSQRANVGPAALGTLEGVKTTAVADIEQGAPRVRVFFNTGLSQGGFSVTPETARVLAQKLTDAADHLARVMPQRQAEGWV